MDRRLPLRLLPALLASSAAYAVPQAQQASGTESGSLPWTWLILLGALTLGGLFYLRRSERPVADPYPETRPAPGWETESQERQRFYHVGKGVATDIARSGKLPDGTETRAFLRHAKATFLHLRAEADSSKREQLRKYLAPELFEELNRPDIAQGELAEFPELHIELVNAEQQGEQLVAHVRYYGKVVASANSAPFQETWRFARRQGGNQRWLLWSMSEQD
ncbi:hypothetical protein [Chitinolyticbacter meiyuanensis]|uniref:hypothetical protein n=1 Tax=Chitinolyticbacter meiyuanensis TaxID=682798 RepID=UPI0011E5D1FB|nr:hypothetical protein [Chitinolyticbacter meiyuanensis]